MFPATGQDSALPRSSPLVAANGSAIRTFSKRDLELSFAPAHKVIQSFWIAQVRRPILGANFFIEQGLLIDLPNQRLVDAPPSPTGADLHPVPW